MYGRYMKKVLLTGGTGFIGRNIKQPLSEVCELYVPTRNELNLLEEQEVKKYLCKKQIDIVIHAANPNPVKNTLDKQETMFADSIRVFMNLYCAEEYYDRMYTLGSGAEYDKSKDIVLISEEEEGRSIPYDSYGLAKFTMNQLIEHSNKQCNLRIFACYGPTDHESKFITHAIRCCLNQEPITIRQDCYFDYMHVSDLTKVLKHFIFHDPVYKAYNVCTGKRYLLSQIADMVRKKMKAENDIIILKEGLNKEYTGSNKRLIEELGDFQFLSIESGIDLQIGSEIR